MRFFADLHVHSHFSRATSRDMTLENMWKWAQLKGLKVIGTGDFTHPAWFKEISRKLNPEGDGLFSLKKEFQVPVPSSLRRETFFLLSCELSFVYTKRGRTRKVHMLILLPDLRSVERLNGELNRRGNTSSDGRPVFGMDVQEMMRIGLDVCGDILFIPAHVWTPHFSLFGSESGFDSIEECFEGLSRYIKAIETGLSSDPKMNWRLSKLDGITLVSNSDAHSPKNLGREANLFDTELSYAAIREAIEKRKGLLCTIEFFPEEGKYHFDGHRACGVVMSPEETMARGYLCPKCGKRLTIGVMHRVEMLADREEGVRPAGAPPFLSLIPLHEVVAEAMGLQTSSARVSQEYLRLVEKYGGEFPLLVDVEEEALEDRAVPLLREAVRRMRAGEVEISPGFDGEYGKIRIFGAEEREARRGQQSLF
jgi:uncharacterized protein (TIGR00375 family)